MFSVRRGAAFIALAVAAFTAALVVACPGDDDPQNTHTHCTHGGSPNAEPPKKGSPVLPYTVMATHTSTYVKAATISAVTSIAPALLVLMAPSSLSQRALDVLLSFAAGGLLGDSFLHILPDAFAAGGGHHHHHHAGHDDHHKCQADVVARWWLPSAPCLVLVGFAIMFLLDGVLASCGGSGHGHSHGSGHSHSAGSDKKSKSKAADASASAQQTAASRAFLNLVSDTVHNVTDGMLLGAAAFGPSAAMWRTTAAVTVHEVPHELGDFAVLKACGWGNGRIFLAQLVTALGNFGGAMLVVAAGTEFEAVRLSMAPLIAGTFVYMATVGILGDVSGRARDPTATLGFRVALVTAFSAGVAFLQVVELVEAGLDVHIH